jgi:hypothetical protein
MKLFKKKEDMKLLLYEYILEESQHNHTNILEVFEYFVPFLFRTKRELNKVKERDDLVTVFSLISWHNLLGVHNAFVDDSVLKITPTLKILQAEHFNRPREEADRTAAETVKGFMADGFPVLNDPSLNVYKVFYDMLYAVVYKSLLDEHHQLILLNVDAHKVFSTLIDDNSEEAQQRLQDLDVFKNTSTESLKDVWMNTCFEPACNYVEKVVINEIQRRRDLSEKS